MIFANLTAFVIGAIFFGVKLVTATMAASVVLYATLFVICAIIPVSFFVDFVRGWWRGR